MTWMNVLAPARWTFAIGLLCTALLGLYTRTFEICATTTADNMVERTCTQPTATDAITIATAVAIVLLIAPELGEISVLGVTLKQRLTLVENLTSTTATRTDQLTNELQVQSARLDAITLTVANSSANASSNANANIFMVTASDLQASQGELAQKYNAYISGGPVPSSSRQPRHRTAHYYAQVGRLIDNWEWLVDALDLPTGGRPRPKTSSWDDRRNRFIEVFAEELDIVRAARNTVAHAGSLSGAELETVVEMSASLVSLWRESTS